jgi:cytochrome c2
VSDGLWRWLVGGLAGGAIILGLLVAAYAIGYHRGKDHPREAAPAPPSTVTPTTTRARPPDQVQGSPALVARGKSLFADDGCSACHSLTGAAGVGPSLNDITGNKVTLTNGETITADDAYLEQSILDPDAQVVKGYRAGVMPAAIESFNLPNKPDDVHALVAFVKSQK